MIHIFTRLPAFVYCSRSSVREKQREDPTVSSAKFVPQSAIYFEVSLGCLHQDQFSLKMSFEEEQKENEL